MSTHRSWSLYLQKPVPVPQGWFLVAETVRDAHKAIRKHGMPVHIDFDYWIDHRGIPKPGPSAVDLARWIAERCVCYPEGFSVYSANCEAHIELADILGLKAVKAQELA